MLSMQAFYNQVSRDETPYLGALHRIIQAPRKAIKDLTVAVAWRVW